MDQRVIVPAPRISGGCWGKLHSQGPRVSRNSPFRGGTQRLPHLSPRPGHKASPARGALLLAAIPVQTHWSKETMNEQVFSSHRLYPQTPPIHCLPHPGALHRPAGCRRRASPTRQSRAPTSASTEQGRNKKNTGRWLLRHRKGGGQRGAFNYSNRLNCLRR